MESGCGASHNVQCRVLMINLVERQAAVAAARAVTFAVTGDTTFQLQESPSPCQLQLITHIQGATVVRLQEPGVRS